MPEPPDPIHDTRDKERIEAVVRSGMPRPQVRGRALGPIQVTCRRHGALAAADEQAGHAALGLQATRKSLPLFDAKSTRVMSMPLWRRRLPQVHVPDLEIDSHGIHAPNLVPAAPQIRRGRFRPPMVACHLIQLPPKASIAKPGHRPDVPWCLPTYPLKAFSAKARTFLRWYARERLKFDPDHPSVLGLCCPVPAMQLHLVVWQAYSSGYGGLTVEPLGQPDRQLEDRQGFLIREQDGLKLHLLPAQSGS